MLLKKHPIEILGHNVDTDFKKWLKIGSILSSRSLHDHEKIQICLINIFGDIEYSNEDEALEYFDALIKFYSLEQEDRGLDKPKELLLDWEYDSDTVWSDFLIYAQIDLECATMHWWKFRALFDSLPSESHIKRLMAARSEDISDYSGKGRDRERHMVRQRKLSAAIYPDIGDDFDFEYARVNDGG